MTFWDTLILQIYFLMLGIDYFPGDLTDVLAKTKKLTAAQDGWLATFMWSVRQELRRAFFAAVTAVDILRVRSRFCKRSGASACWLMCVRV